MSFKFLSFCLISITGFVIIVFCCFWILIWKILRQEKPDCDVDFLLSIFYQFFWKTGIISLVNLQSYMGKKTRPVNTSFNIPLGIKILPTWNYYKCLLECLHCKEILSFYLWKPFKFVLDGEFHPCERLFWVFLIAC